MICIEILVCWPPIHHCIYTLLLSVVSDHIHAQVTLCGHHKLTCHTVHQTKPSFASGYWNSFYSILMLHYSQWFQKMLPIVNIFNFLYQDALIAPFPPSMIYQSAINPQPTWTLIKARTGRLQNFRFPVWIFQDFKIKYLPFMIVIKEATSMEMKLL